MVKAAIDIIIVFLEPTQSSIQAKVAAPIPEVTFIAIPNWINSVNVNPNVPAAYMPPKANKVLRPSV